MENVQIYSLTDEQRIQAKQEARNVVIAQYGNEPTREQFERPLPILPNRDEYQSRTISEYPQWLIYTIGAFMAVVFIAAALPSLFRLYRVGYDYFYQGIESNAQAQIVGVSTFLLAEFLIVLSTVAMRVLFKSRLARAFFVIPIVLGLAMAFVGNWTITQPHDAMSWLETIAPPMAVLFTALIGEQLILNAIRTRYSNERLYQQDRRAIEIERRQQQEAEKLAYQNALTAWHDATKQPENSDYWLSAYANSLKQAILDANDYGRGKTERMAYLHDLDRNQWIELIRTEIQSEQWFDETYLTSKPEVPSASVANFTQAPVLEIPMMTSSNGNGNH